MTTVALLDSVLNSQRALSQTDDSTDSHTAKRFVNRRKQREATATDLHEPLGLRLLEGRLDGVESPFKIAA